MGTAFGPLGGDQVIVHLRVEAGAHLQVSSAAAAVCLPARTTAPSRTELYATVADGASLEILLEPSVVAHCAEHHAVSAAELAGTGRLRLTERVMLGRHGEPPGQWSGTTRVERDGVPLVHTTLALGPDAPAWRPPMTPRAYATDLLVDEQAERESRTEGCAVLLPLPGGRISTAWGERLDQVLAAIDRLTEIRP